MEKISTRVHAGVRVLFVQALDAPLELSFFELVSVQALIVAGGSAPVHPDWVRSLRNQANAHGVAFTFVSWGEWVPATRDRAEGTIEIDVPLEGAGELLVESPAMHIFEDGQVVARVGRSRSGRTLDGKIWQEWPI